MQHTFFPPILFFSSPFHEKHMQMQNCWYHVKRAEHNGEFRVVFRKKKKQFKNVLLLFLVQKRQSIVLTQHLATVAWRSLLIESWTIGEENGQKDHNIIEKIPRPMPCAPCLCCVYFFTFNHICSYGSAALFQEMLALRWHTSTSVWVRERHLMVHCV